MRIHRAVLAFGLVVLLTSCFSLPATPDWQIGRDLSDAGGDTTPDLPPDVPPDLPEVDAVDVADLADPSDAEAEPAELEPADEAGPEPLEVVEIDTAPCEAVACDPDATPDLELGACERLQWNPATCACEPVPADSGLACDDDEPCTVHDACDGNGACAGTWLTCDDGDPCTADHCEAGLGCQHGPAAGPCDDGNGCTQGDACLDGACASGALLAACISCEPASDTCEAGWGDDNPCNGRLACLQGVCAIDPDSVVHCDAGADTACLRSVCDPATGTCSPQARYDGAPCSDTNACTGFDACHDGACVGVFDLQTEGCACQVDADCVAFDDGDRCDGVVRCLDGRCLLDAASVPAPCDPSLDTACRQSRCNPASGLCQMVDLPPVTACDDGNPCTLADHCDGGQCVHEAVNACSQVADACHVGVCLPATGACLAVPANEGAVCDVADACVLQARCVAGQCTPREQVECDDADACTVDACDPGSGTCSHQRVPADTPERCNGIDDDCDGAIDEQLVYADPSGGERAPGQPCHGRGVCGEGTAECAPDGSVTCSTNADGTTPAGADETCNGHDDDCDGVTDDGVVWMGLPVGDACDGIGACGAGVVECAADGTATCSTNRDGSASEAADEVCNGADDDCDGLTDDGLAAFDSACRFEGACAGGILPVACRGVDGWSCDYTGVPGYQAGDEVGRCDGVDNDCDGLTDEDFAGLGEACDGPDADACAHGHVACRADGADAACVGDAAAFETCNGTDDDCDGLTDEADAGGCTTYHRDLDGDDHGAPSDARCLCAPDTVAMYTSESDDDCDDSVATGAAVHPEADETCNGVDDDCDGLTDAADTPEAQVSEPAAAATQPLVPASCALQEGACAGATALAARCVDGAWAACTAADYQARALAYQADYEIDCDGVDNDCDGSADEDFEYPGPTGSTLYGPGRTCGRGRCQGGVTQCRADGGGLRCSTSDQARAETCNGIDDDCDGLVDAADPDLATTDVRLCDLQKGACAGTRKPVSLCVDGAWKACEAIDYVAQSADFEAGTEATCDGLDNDCDGAVDDDLAFVRADGVTVYGPGQACGVGTCAAATTACAAGASSLTCSLGGAASETCNGKDDDCDGLVDATDPDLAPTPCERQLGVCAGAVHAASQCAAGSWAPCDGARYLATSALWQSGAESACDGYDNDCDGKVDDDLAWTGPDGVIVTGVGVACGAGACGGGTTACVGPLTLGCSTAGTAASETCNGEDDDCDGRTDEGLDAHAVDAPCLFQGACTRENVVATCAGGTWTCSYARVTDYEAGTETWCDGVDNDCDGQTDEDFALPGGETKGQACTRGACTGRAVCAPTADSLACTADTGIEICNAKDDDCDALIDEGLLYREPLTGRLLAKGEACKGKGSCGVGVVECSVTGGITCSTNPDGSASQATAELCNGKDDDCDGDVDDGLTWRGLALYAACDGDGACGFGIVECGSQGVATCSTNPDGSLPQAKAESCNAKDDDCDGLTDALDPGMAHPLCEVQTGVCAGAVRPDRLCSGGAWVSCDAAAYRAHSALYQPGVETACDGQDNDCDGQTDEDFSWTGPDGAVVTGLAVACGAGVCAGGYTACRSDQSGLRCSTQGKAGAERCNGQDDDCDGKTDAADPVDLAAYDHPTCELQAGSCGGATKPVSLCRSGGWTACTAAEYLAHDARYQSGAETQCDGYDNDCDGVTDDDFSFTQRDGVAVHGAGQPCGAGICAGGVTACNAAKNGLTCPGEASASGEACNGNDDDCDGLTDAADALDLLANDAHACGNQSGVCAGAVAPASLCEEGTWGACTAAVYTAYDSAYQAGAEVTCDGRDNDCDGQTDEDFVLVGPSAATYAGLGVACGVGACAGGQTVCRDDHAGITCSTFALMQAEACNGQDDDCDGRTDAADPIDLAEGDPRPCERTSGVCAGATKPASLCVAGGWQACPDAVYAAHDGMYQAGTEISCDGRDNDCDGTTDDDFSLTLLSGATVTGVGQVCGAGACAGGTTACAASGAGVVCLSEALATPEVCDGRDNDCDGTSDAADADLETSDPQPCALQAGACAGSRKPARLCVAGVWGACDGDVYASNDAAYEAGVETSCDGRDNDCDGAVDDEFSTLGADGTVVTGSGRACGAGRCAGGTTVCKADQKTLVCSTADQAQPEVCNGQDDDCDGLRDAADAADLLAHDGRPCERQGGVCAGTDKPAALCRQGTWAACGDATYRAASPAYESGAEVACDGKDNDCDGATDGGQADTDGDGSADCVDPDDDDDGRADTTDGCPLAADPSQVDTDDDGQGDACDDDDDDDGDPDGTDCAPQDPSVFLGAAERCNGLDDDCDGLTDGDDPDLAVTDAPACENTEGVCAGASKRPARCVAGVWQACGPADYAAYALAFEPGSEITCDGQDNDCDGTADDDFAWLGGDGDEARTKGDPCGDQACPGAVVVCDPLGAGLVCSTDLATGLELCDGQDNDCDGLTDAQDSDLGATDAPPCERQHGVCAGATKPASLCVAGAWQACDDAAYAAWTDWYHAGAEALCDGLDDDCDGAVDDDFSVTAPDGVVLQGVGVACGAGACRGGVTVCRDDYTGITCSTFGAASDEVCDGHDNDCDGGTDGADPDDVIEGHLRHDQPPCAAQAGVCKGSLHDASLCVAGSWYDCTDATYRAHTALFQPGVEAACDGFDNDCSGEADEDFALVQADGRTAVGVGAPCGSGACQGGELTCTPSGQGVACSTAYLAAGETCNGQDDDCDGHVDAADAADLLANDGRTCEHQTGLCAGATKPAALCAGGAWLPCTAEQYGPAYQDGAEVGCDGLDNDCDGAVDDDFTVVGPEGAVYQGPGVPCGVGACSGGVTACLPGGRGLRCHTLSNVAPEACNGRDDDCDGATDEGLGAACLPVP